LAFGVGTKVIAAAAHMGPLKELAPRGAGAKPFGARSTNKGNCRGCAHGTAERIGPETAGRRDIFSHDIPPLMLLRALLCVKLARASWEQKRDTYLDLAGYACILVDVLAPKE